MREVQVGSTVSFVCSITTNVASRVVSCPTCTVQFLLAWHRMSRLSKFGLFHLFEYTPQNSTPRCTVAFAAEHPPAATAAAAAANEFSGGSGQQKTKQSSSPHAYLRSTPRTREVAVHHLAVHHTVAHLEHLGKSYVRGASLEQQSKAANRASQTEPSRAVRRFFSLGGCRQIDDKKRACSRAASGLRLAADKSISTTNASANLCMYVCLYVNVLRTRYRSINELYIEVLADFEVRNPHSEKSF